MPVWTASPTSFCSSTADPDARARSAAGTATPMSVPAGLIPVYGAPSPARWMRTSASKKRVSAATLASPPAWRPARAFSNSSRIAASSFGCTQTRTRFTLPVSSAWRASDTTGPDIVSQCALARPGATSSAAVTTANAIAWFILGILTTDLLAPDSRSSNTGPLVSKRLFTYHGNQLRRGGHGRKADVGAAVRDRRGCDAAARNQGGAPLHGAAPRRRDRCDRRCDLPPLREHGGSHGGRGGADRRRALRGLPPGCGRPPRAVAALLPPADPECPRPSVQLAPAPVRPPGAGGGQGPGSASGGVQAAVTDVRPRLSARGGTGRAPHLGDERRGRRCGGARLDPRARARGRPGRRGDDAGPPLRGSVVRHRADASRPDPGQRADEGPSEWRPTMTKHPDDKAPAKFTGGKALELVAYQAGAVVSREIVRKKTGSVTAFAFDQGEGLSEHTAPFDALVHVVDGVAEITVGGEPHRVSQGELILMPANVPHALKAVERFKMLLVMIREPTT